MEFLHNICTTELVKSIKEEPVYTKRLIACREQEVSVPFAVVRTLFSTCDCFAASSVAAQHLVCHLRVELLEIKESLLLLFVGYSHHISFLSVS